MIINLKPYLAYKDSGVEWLGKVPEHWEVVPLKRLAWFKSGAGFPVHHQGDASAEIPFFKVSDMNIPGNEKYLRVCANTVSMTVAQGLGATVFPAGTIVFPKVGGALLTNKRRIAANQCCIDNNMMACVARNGNRDFLFLVMSYIDLSQIAQPGPVPAISEGEVREIRVCLPSAAEQTAIVRFLDWAEQRIRRVIRARQRRIKLLEEYKQALIHQAVTGQIDVRTGRPYPAYKDSGVEWLGQVPEHWEVLPGRTVFREVNDRGHPDEQMLSVTITRGVLRQADLLADSSKKDSSNEDKSNYKLVQPGDLVYNKMRAWQGAVGVSAYRGVVSPAYIVQRLRSTENLPRYMHFLLRTPLFASEAERWSYGITSDQWSLRTEEFKCIYFLLPPLPEQTAIVEYLDAQTAKIDAAIAAARREIELLREYRTRLISDVVTGKVDVRTVKCEVGSVNDEMEEDEVGWEEAHYEDGEVEDGLEGEMCETDKNEET